MALAQERQSLEVEETLERVSTIVGLRSAGTVWQRIEELEAAGWLVRLTRGRKGHWGSVWRIEVPPGLRPRRCRPPLGNRDIKKATSDPRLSSCLGEEIDIKPRLAAPSSLSQPTPNPKSAAKDGDPPPAPEQNPTAASPQPLQPNNQTQSKAKPRRTRVLPTKPAQAPVGSGLSSARGLPRILQVWPPAEYGAMRAAVERAAGPGAEADRQLASQVRMVTRVLLAGDFTPRDVAAAVVKVGICPPMRLRAILEGGHIDLPPRAVPEIPAGPVRELVAQLAAALPDLDERPRPRGRVRDVEAEERAESLAWEAERARILAVLDEQIGGSFGQVRWRP